MILSSITVSLVPSLKGGPWVYRDDPEISFPKAKAAGFDAVELFAASAEAVDAGLLLKLLDELDLKICAVGTGAGSVLQRLHLTSPDDDIRQKAILFIRNMIDLGSRFGAPAIIGSMQGHVGEGVDREEAFAWLKESLEELGQHAADRGVRLLYEPLNRYETNLVNRLGEGVDLIESLTCENVFLLADLFHMNIEEESIPRAIRAASSHIGHVHFVDSNRRPAGMGHIDLKSVGRALQEIGFDGYASAEALCYPDADSAASQTIAAFQEFLARAH